jgi:hypothetical protein
MFQPEVNTTKMRKALWPPLGRLWENGYHEGDWSRRPALPLDLPDQPLILNLGHWLMKVMGF